MANQSADFSLQDQLSALQAALTAGAITQAQYTTQYNILTNPPEPFSLVKFLEGMLSVLEPTNWAKDFAAIFNIRRLIIIGLIIGAFCWGLRDRIPTFNLGPNSLQGKSFSIDLGDGRSLILNKNGQLQVVNNKTKKVEKTIRVKDIPALQKAINPIGFQCKLIGVLGAGAGTTQGFGVEGGAGVSWFHYHQWETDTFVTNKAFYPLGISYRFEKFAGGNTSVGLAVSPFGFHHGDKRVLLYFRWAF